MVLHMLCMNTNTNTFTYNARSDGESVSTVSWQTKYFLLSFCQLYSGTNFIMRFFQLDCLVLIPSPPLPRLITSTQSPAAHSEETLSHPGLPHTDVISPHCGPRHIGSKGSKSYSSKGSMLYSSKGSKLYSSKGSKMYSSSSYMASRLHLLVLVSP